MTDDKQTDDSGQGASKLDPCDPEVYKYGETLFMTAQRAADAEAWVEKLRERSGQRVDWHYVAGRAIVKALGDADAVIRAAWELRDHFNPWKRARVFGARPQNGTENPPISVLRASLRGCPFARKALAEHATTQPDPEE